MTCGESKTWPISVCLKLVHSKILDSELRQSRLAYRLSSPIRVTPKPTILSSIKRFFVSEDGPTPAEYAVMLALIMGLLVGSLHVLGPKVKSGYNNANNQLGS
jgi:pilus assembly protein Flp/PilA